MAKDNYIDGTFSRNIMPIQSILDINGPLLNHFGLSWFVSIGISDVFQEISFNLGIRLICRRGAPQEDGSCTKDSNKTFHNLLLFNQQQK